MEGRKAIKVIVKFEVKEYTEDRQDFQENLYDDYYTENSEIEDDSYELLFNLPESRDELVDVLERWVDYIPDDYSQSEIDDGFGMINFDDSSDEYEEMAEFSAKDPEDINHMNTSTPANIVIYFNDGSEEEVEITAQEETLNRVLELIDK